MMAFARLGQRQLSRRALEQTRTEPFLEHADALRAQRPETRPSPRPAADILPVLATRAKMSKSLMVVTVRPIARSLEGLREPAGPSGCHTLHPTPGTSRDTKAPWIQSLMQQRLASIASFVDIVHAHRARNSEDRDVDRAS